MGNRNYYCMNYVYQEDVMWITKHSIATDMTLYKFLGIHQFTGCFMKNTAECHGVSDEKSCSSPASRQASLTEIQTVDDR